MQILHCFVSLAFVHTLAKMSLSMYCICCTFTGCTCCAFTGFICYRLPFLGHPYNQRVQFTCFLAVHDLLFVLVINVAFCLVLLHQMCQCRLTTQFILCTINFAAAHMNLCNVFICKINKYSFEKCIRS